MLKINNIDHLNFNVKSLKESIDFYRQYFHFEVKEEGISSLGNPYAIVGDKNKFFLCLYENPSPEGTPLLNHFGVHVQDFDHTLQVLQENDIELLYGGVVDYPNSRSVYIADPSGNEIELSEVFGGGFQ